jgi:hypothetical protein
MASTKNKFTLRTPSHVAFSLLGSYMKCTDDRFGLPAPAGIGIKWFQDSLGDKIYMVLATGN